LTKYIDQIVICSI